MTTSRDESRDQPDNLADRSLRSAVGREATTFGFSIMITVTFGVVQDEHGAAAKHDLVYFTIGAVLSFVLLEAVLSRGFRAAMPQHRTPVIAIGTALNLASVVAAVGAAIGMASLIETDIAWPVCPFVAGIVYLLFESAGEAVGEIIERRRGREDAAAVDP